MTARRIILACFLGLISAQTVRAETPCSTLSDMIESVSLVRQIQNDPAGQRYRAHIDRLNDVTAQISLTDIIPVDPAASRPTDRDALIRYVSGLRAAVSSAASSDETYVNQTLEAIITPEVFSGLSSLGSHWDCNGEEISQQNDVDLDRETKAVTASDSNAAKTGPNGPANTAESSINSRNRQSSMGDGNGTSFGRDSIVPGSVMVFFVMLLVMALIAAFFYAQSRARNKTVRETRRALNIPVRAKLNNQACQMRLVDISMNGFKLRHSSQINGQTEIDVNLCGDWHQGQIRWANPHYAGVKFKRAIDSETLSLVMANPNLDAPLDAAA